MIKETLINQFSKDLNRLANEVKTFANEKEMWLVKKGISNSVGNLTIHLLGNLNHFIGHFLGNTGYIRNRSFEFSGKDVSRVQILTEIDETTVMIKKVVTALNDEELIQEYPFQIYTNEPPMTTFAMLVHLSNHLNYHLGQINYYRRLTIN